MNRDDFPMLNNDIIYFDNSATTLKPNCMIEATVDYYRNYSANAHRGDYDISYKVDDEYESTRTLVKKLIGAKDTKEIIFTSGTTDSLNKIIFGYFKNNLVAGDEVLVTKTEHASVLLPWFELADELKLAVNYIKLVESDYSVTLANVKSAITKNTKVICLAHITNVIGDVRPIKEIIEYAHSLGILVVIDGAQSVGHMPIDVVDLDIDFLAFSAHKMMGPTGVGVLYGKEELLNKTYPITFGGGMNATFMADMRRTYHELPHRLEAGTPNIAGVIGFKASLNYLLDIGLNKIMKYDLDLKKYALKRFEEIPDLTIYNSSSESGIIAFNMLDVFAQDLAIYLNRYNICLRAGNHCAKIAKDELGVKNTCRLSFYLYNTYEEIDRLVDALKNPHLKEEII